MPHASANDAPQKRYGDSAFGMPNASIGMNDPNMRKTMDSSRARAVEAMPTQSNAPAMAPQIVSINLKCYFFRIRCFYVCFLNR